MTTDRVWDYQRLKKLVQGEPFPAMIVDLDVLDANVTRLSEIARAHGKHIRTASKSVRVPELIRRICKVGGDHFRGLMCFSPQEARLLSAEGFDDLLIAYPSVQESDLETLWQLTQDGKIVSIVIDEQAHLDIINDFWARKSRDRDELRPLRVCLEADMSWRPLGLHLGAHRSPIRSIGDFERLLEGVLRSAHLKLAGILAYEAQIAGLTDDNPFTPLSNPLKKLVKWCSRRSVAKARAEIAGLLRARDVGLEFFNGGGTGSIQTTSMEDCITEVAAGSGFLQSHLFDYYGANQNRAAFCFALQVTRVPQPDMVTCQSGGFIASGEIATDKAPLPFLPRGLKPVGNEGFGEVQTPLRVPKELRGTLRPGDPVFFRPAKAGEIAEHFDEYLLTQSNRIVGRARTYRGMGHCFY
jgi:D-serine deaminase-like pyridoxal phosphate-dependent protein